MPNDQYDVNEIARLLSEGKSMTEIASALDGPQVDQAAAAQRQRLQDQRGALNAEAAPPGQEPVEDPVEGHDRGGSAQRLPTRLPRLHRRRLERLFEAAKAGDARVVTQGTVDRETAERWHRDGVQRQVANRERSGFTRPH